MNQVLKERKNMNYGITREEGLELVHTHIKNQNLVNHCLAAEAVLRAMAEKLGEDQEKWGLAGLLHDLDAKHNLTWQHIHPRL